MIGDGTRVFGRRGALLTLAGVALPFAGRGQTEPPAFSPPTPAPQVVTPPPAVTVLPAAPGQAATRPRPALPTNAIDKTKIYYLFFDQMIDMNSMKALRRQLASLVEAGVSQVVLVINSPGGLVLETVVTYRFIRALPIQVETHAQGLVASAATVLFLAGQERTADRMAHFVFHPGTQPFVGLMNQQQVEDQVAVSRSVLDAVNGIYKDRTGLSAEQIQQFGRGEVIYTAEQAAQYGIVQTVADLKFPGEQTARMLLLD